MTFELVLKSKKQYQFYMRAVTRNYEFCYYGFTVANSNATKSRPLSSHVQQKDRDELANRTSNYTLTKNVQDKGIPREFVINPIQYETIYCSGLSMYTLQLPTQMQLSHAP